MNRITSLGGFLTLLYIWYNFKEWTLTANETNILSPYLVKILKIIPNFLISTMIILVLIFLILNIFLNIRIFFLNTVLRLLLFVIFMIGLNMLMLEETTTLYLIKIHHPISLEYKYKYFITLLEDRITANNMVILPEITEKLNTLITPEFVQKLKTMNVKQINDVIVEILNSLNQLRNDMLMKEEAFELMIENYIFNYIKYTIILATCLEIYCRYTH